MRRFFRKQPAKNRLESESCRSRALCDQGQASIEYILLLAIAIFLFTIVAKQLISPSMSKLKDAISNKMNRMLFSGDLHQIRLGR